MFVVKGDRPAARIQQAFEDEAKHRHTRTFEEWSRLELDRVFDATNDERLKLGKAAISRADVENAMNCARGHIDFSLKWSLYCELLVFK